MRQNNQHMWHESSGTTMQCETCGAYRFSELMDGRPIGHGRAERFRYGRSLGERRRDEPICASSPASNKVSP